jgi:hypothetical protein
LEFAFPKLRGSLSFCFTQSMVRVRQIYNVRLITN